MQGLTRSAIGADSIVTLYWGDGATESQALEAQLAIEESYPGVQVDVVQGDQPHYPYLASVE